MSIAVSPKKVDVKGSGSARSLSGPEVGFEEIAMNSSVRSAGACLARTQGASWWREQRALCSFRPAALYSADTQA